MLFPPVSLSPPDDHNLSFEMIFFSEFVNVNRITTKKWFSD